VRISEVIRPSPVNRGASRLSRRWKVVGCASNLTLGSRVREPPMCTPSSVLTHSEWLLRGHRMGVYPVKRSRIGWDAVARVARTM
jgi:hypothetical protein